MYKSLYCSLAAIIHTSKHGREINTLEVSISFYNKTWRTDQSDLAINSENLEMIAWKRVQIIFEKGKDHYKYLSVNCRTVPPLVITFTQKSVYVYWGSVFICPFK